VTATSQPGHPKTIGRYRIEAVLGEGAMSVVYAGFDPSIARPLAIKVLRDEVMQDENYRRRFLAEARAAGTLTHPNIVTVYDVGETDGNPYIAMERLDGETLEERVARLGFPPTEVIIDIVGQIAAALDFAHRHGVVHQDIKPDNIVMVDGWGHAKVNDFGVARLLDASAESDDGMVAGTPGYMSPEQLRGETTDGRSDLYSLGVMLYWLLCRHLPWRRENDVNRLIKARLHTPLPPVVPRDPATPDVLVEITRTLMQTDPEQRYQTGNEVIEDLRHAQRELDRQREAPVATRIIPMRLRWAGVLGVVLAVTLLAGLGAVYVKQNAAMTGVTLDFGASLGRTIAGQTAEDLLLGDRIAVRAAVGDMQQNSHIRYLAVADREGTVIASGRPQEVGVPLADLPAERRLPANGDISSYRGGVDGQDMLLFDVPIRYQGHDIGTLRLGVSAEPLQAANRTTLLSMLAALFVTLVVVLGAAWWLFRRLATPIDVLRHSLLRIARGDFGHRIRLQRRDEFGPLFGAFNLMSETLETCRWQSGESRSEPEHKARDGDAEPTRLIEPIAEDDRPPGRRREDPTAPERAGQSPGRSSHDGIGR
jgi:serine/threonine-protein kinase